MGVLSRNGYLGQKLQNFYNINKIIVPKYFRNHAWGEPMWKVQSVHDLLQSQGNEGEYDMHDTIWAMSSGHIVWSI